MKRLFNSLFQKIGFSILEDNKHSSSRIQSYIVLAPIILMALIFLSPPPIITRWLLLPFFPTKERKFF